MDFWTPYTEKLIFNDFYFSLTLIVSFFKSRIAGSSGMLNSFTRIEGK